MNCEVIVNIKKFDKNRKMSSLFCKNLLRYIYNLKHRRVMIKKIASRKTKYVGGFVKKMNGYNQITPILVYANNCKDAVHQIANISYEQYTKTGKSNGIFKTLHKYTKEATFVYSVDEWGHIKKMKTIINNPITENKKTNNGLQKIGDDVYANDNLTEIYL